MSTLTNGDLVAAVRGEIETRLRETGQRPGRRVLASTLGVTEHQVRSALAALDEGLADDAEEHPEAGEAGDERATATPEAGAVAATQATGWATPGAEAPPAGYQLRPVGGDAGGVELPAAPTAAETTMPIPVVGVDGLPVGEDRAEPGVKRVSSWPLLLLALPAFVAIWGGWVGLGGMTGFGPINLAPGIGNGWEINSAITLPIGLEVYAAYALHVWLSGARGTTARQFAQWSAIGSLALGAAGQVAYHLLEAAGRESAPWGVTVVVAIIPVIVLGCGAALAHLVRRDLAVSSK